MSTTSPTAALADLAWLVSPAAAACLSSAAEERDPLARAARLRSELSAERARLVAQQVELRHRAARKFAAAERMFFTPVGLEQATDGWTAAYKAARFAGAGRVLDFCCGIGGDLTALATRTAAHGVDRDPAAALLAEANCRALLELSPAGEPTFPAAAVTVGDVSPDQLVADDAWHIDPDRRPSGRRTTQVALHDPPAGVIDSLLAAAPAGAVKLAPAAELPAAWRDAAELEWISSARECRQLVAWFGPLAGQPGRHRATLVPRGGEPGAAAPASFSGLPDVECPVAAVVGQYVFDPDPALVAARLVGALAREQGLAALVAGGAYLTADHPLDHPLLAALAVSEVVPWDVRRLKRLLAERRIGRLEVKQRGTRFDPATVARELKVAGDAAATLILYRRAKSVVAILAERVG
ncbi:MAG TPA: hypothetical protein VMF30_15080 [Pirellulales bacterium]|nr:hypothetical protein [Pirellulales bacterium]